MSRLRANALLLLAALIWGSAFVGQSLGLAGVGPLICTGLRFVLGALVVVLPLAWREWQQVKAAGHAPGRAEARLVGAAGRPAVMGDRLTALGLAGCALMLGCILAVQVLPLWRRRPALG